MTTTTLAYIKEDPPSTITCPCIGKTVNVQNGHMATYIYSPNAIKSRIFIYSEDTPAIGAPRGKVEFYYRNDPRNGWYRWRTATLRYNPIVTQFLISRSKSSQFKITLTPFTTNYMTGKIYLV